VGDLTPDVDDYTLLAAFAAQYPSTCSAKGIQIQLKFNHKSILISIQISFDFNSN
jgi:hypothetical protein